MANQPGAALYNIFGLVIWGDFGPWTMYRRHDGRLVFFLKTWPDKPPSPDQLTQRAAFAAAATDWNALTNAQREGWTTAAARASICGTGYNLFLHNRLHPHPAALATLARQTATTLTP